MTTVVAALVNGLTAFTQNLADESTGRPTLKKIALTGYKPASSSLLSEKGRSLFANSNCMACHSIHNAGGDLGPALDGIGARRSEQYLLEHLTDDDMEQDERLNKDAVSKQKKPTIHSTYSREIATSLAAYLMTLPEPPDGFVVVPHTSRIAADNPPPSRRPFKPLTQSAETARGQKLFRERGCMACHSIDDVGGWLGPPLDGIGATRDKNFILEKINDQGAATPNNQDDIPTTTSRMARFRLPASESNDIVQYLLSLPELHRP